ncbi:hypothetical protein BDF20DRAFT_904480 [Mycotypha africana]|uniref:uncharacterized protein n=1 Tax=Mycotypha africana TaxID=64632 RepID=UPI0023002630|nr:uncharacterized protein BDF20DRAFT_904480 [Mycotypha africana]KAI8987295.1 hypothetical protein BDF20DRAFT_904480 [Mycotypha africana]
MSLPNKTKYVLVYGDSYSDDSADIQPGTKRTNGPIWSQQLAAEWNIKLISQAKPGATFCKNSNKNGSWLQKQVEDGQQQIGSVMGEEGSNSVIHIIFLGVTDLMETKVEAATESINYWLQCIKDQVTYIQTKNPKAQIIVMGVPALEFSPYALLHKQSTVNLKQNIIDFNAALEDELSEWQQQQSTSNVNFFDTYSVFSNVLGDPTSIAGIKNVNDAYWDVCQGRCADPVNDYLWWDSIHLTGSGHYAISKAIQSEGFFTTEAITSTATEMSRVSSPYIRFVSWFILLSIVAMILFMLRHNRIVVSLKKKLQMSAAKIYPSCAPNRGTHEYTLV